MIALHEQEQAEAAEKCPLCGLPKAVCRATENQLAFDVEREQCHATWAIEGERAKHDKVDDVSARATVWSAQLAT